MEEPALNPGLFFLIHFLGAKNTPFFPTQMNSIPLPPVRAQPRKFQTGKRMINQVNCHSPMGGGCIFHSVPDFLRSVVNQEPFLSVPSGAFCGIC